MALLTIFQRALASCVVQAPRAVPATCKLRLFKTLVTSFLINFDFIV